MTPESRVESIDVTLGDGETIAVGEARDLRAEAIAAFIAELSPAGRRSRFFAATSQAAAVAEILREDAGTNGGLCLVGQTSGGRIIAHAAMMRVAPDRAEVAFAVVPSYERNGLATIMLRRLAEVAAEKGVVMFEAFVLADNRAMLDTFRNAGFATGIHSRDGEVRVTFPTMRASRDGRNPGRLGTRT